MAVIRFPFTTPEEYLARERVAETKSEYIAGEIIAMVDGNHQHNMIVTDTLRLLGNLLEAAGGTCDVHNSEQKVRIAGEGPFFYPDVTVVCGEPLFDSDDCLRNPYLIVEVLSDSTADYDRVEKFRHYRRFETLRHYILIAQDRIQVEHYARREGFLWDPAGNVTDRSGVISLPDVGIIIPVTEIYRRLPY